jgi:hypothetical protein
LFVVLMWLVVGGRPTYYDLGHTTAVPTLTFRLPAGRLPFDDPNPASPSLTGVNA